MHINSLTPLRLIRTGLRLIAIGVISLLVISCGSNHPQQELTEQTLGLFQEDTDTLTIVAVGDLMLGSAYPDSLPRLPQNDARNSFDAVKDYLKGDVVFGNLEGSFLDSGESVKCKNRDSTQRSCYAFRMPERYAQHFKTAGFNLLSVANNHIGDFGHAGRKRSLALLDSLGIHHAGQLKKPQAIFKIKETRYGFLAFAPNANCVPLLDIVNAQRLVRDLKAQVDIVLVSFHGGAEGNAYQQVTRAEEFFYGENRGNVYAFAHAVIDAGADMVLGHGPHVPRAVELYKNKFIAYSLGNFCTYGSFNLGGPSGLAPLFQIKINKNGDFLMADIISAKQTKSQGLILDPSQAAFLKIQQLTDLDFPGHPFRFIDGQLHLKPQNYVATHTPQ